MTEQTKIVEEVEDVVEEVKANTESVVATVVDTANKLYFASLGAVSYAQEEIVGFSKNVYGEVETRIEKFRSESDTFAEDLISRGETFQADARTRIEDVIKARRTDVESIASDATKPFDGAFDAVMSNFNLPSQDSIEELNKKIGSLGRKIDNLRRAQEKAMAEA